VNENVFKYLAIIMGVVVIWSFCSRSEDRADSYNVEVQTVVSAAEGLNLKAVGELLKKANDAETFEKLLNSKDEGINNLDLNEDGKVDYIFVTEYGNEKVKGFSLTVEPAPGETQEVATIEVEKTTDGQADVQVKGNEQIYGSNHYYRSHFSLTDALILGYLFRPHGFYASPWRYGSYPGYYNRYSPVSHSGYNSRVRNMGSGFRSTSSPVIQSNVKSPNTDKTAQSIRAPLKNPTSSQKAFQARNPSKQVRSGGFGRKSTTRSPSVRSSSSSRSRSFSRGGK
jgi:hypothetical protein